MAPAEKMTAAAAVSAGAASAAAAAAIIVATRDNGDVGDNRSELVCERVLQLFGVMAWVISFAFSALWLQTHCENPSAAALRTYFLACYHRGSNNF
jgi:hypothetical protein